MSISIIASNKAGGAVVGTTGVALTHGFTLLANDVVVLFVGRGDDSATAIACSGFTVLTGSYHEQGAGNDRAGAVLYRICNGSSDGTTWTVTATGDATTVNQEVVAVQLRGVDTSSPLDVASAAWSDTQDALNPDAPDITTVTDGALVLTATVSASGTNETFPSLTPGAPTDYSIVNSGISNGSTSSPRDVFVAVASRIISSAGTQTIGTWTHNLPSDPGTHDTMAWTIAIRPAASTPISSSDTGSGSDAITTLVASISDTETGSGADTASTAASLSSSDTGTGADASSLTVIPPTGTDTGSGADALSDLSVGVADVDTGSDAETASVAAALSDSDSGTGSDAVAIAATITDSDTATGVDDESLLKNIDRSDSDTGSGSDSASLVASISGSESGSAVDSSTLLVEPTSPSDTGVAVETEALVVNISDSDSAVGVDGQSLFTGGDQFDTETGAGVETELVTATISDSDSGSGSDVQSLVSNLSDGDTGTGAEQVASVDAAISASETGAAADTGTITGSYSSSDAGSGVDALASLVTGILDADSGTGIELEDIVAGILDAEAWTGIDDQSIFKSDQIQSLSGITCKVRVSAIPSANIYLSPVPTAAVRLIEGHATVYLSPVPSASLRVGQVPRGQI